MKSTNYYSFNEGLKKILFKFEKKKRNYVYDFFYSALALGIYQKLSSFFLKIIIQFSSFNFYNNNKLLRLLFYSGIKKMKHEEIITIREEHFKEIEAKDININFKYNKIINELREKGVSDISSLFNLSENEISNVTKFFENKSFYDGHEPMQSSLVKKNKNEIEQSNKGHKIFNKGYYSYDQGTSLDCPTISKLINSEHFKKLSEIYCGFKTVPYSLTTMLSLPQKGEHPVTNFHRDYDDFIYLGFFIYWTDTNENNGSTTYRLKSHRKDNGTEKEDKILRVKSGSIIAGDWFGEHRGNSKVSSGKRLLTMIRFGKKINYAYMSTKSYYFF